MSNKLNVIKYDASLQKLASTFSCGNIHLDRFLRTPDSLDDSFGTTYVFLSEDNRTIIGYYNISTGYIEQYDADFHQRIGGSIHINCFALDNKYHGLWQGRTDDGIDIMLSDVLLYDCLERIRLIREQYVGFSFVTLNSTKEGFRLYKRNGFEELEDDMQFTSEKTEYDCLPMYYVMDLI